MAKKKAAAKKKRASKLTPDKKRAEAVKKAKRPRGNQKQVVVGGPGAKGRKSASKLKKSPEYEPCDRDLEIYARLHSGMYMHRELAEEYGLSRQMITKIKAQVDAWTLEKLVDDIRNVKLDHHNRLMVLYAEAMSEWERSKKPAVSTVQGVSGDKEIDTVTTRGQTGNPAFLREAREVLKDIRGIWGADAPLEVRHTGEIRVAGKTLAEAISDKQNQLARLGHVTATSQGHTVIDTTAK
ncbi:hypothetical protein K0U83_21425 [bacterium]|nr:hypothetical protein [bacterium]